MTIDTGPKCPKCGATVYALVEHHCKIDPDSLDAATVEAVATLEAERGRRSAAMGEAPKRRHHLTIVINASTWRHVLAALRDIQFQAMSYHDDDNPYTSAVSAGDDWSYSIEGVHDPDMTEDRYMELVQAWLDEQKRAREASGDE